MNTKSRLITFILLTVFLCSFFIPVYAVSDISAAAAVLMEASGRNVLTEKNAHQQMPMASTTKIMTAIVAIEKCTNLSAPVQISENAIGIEGSSVYLKVGEVLSMEQLLYALLLESANDAAAAIAIEIAGDIPLFAEMMNEKAALLGMKNTHFTNPHGLDDAEHYTTAYDLALLACHALENPLFRKISSTYKATIPMNNGEGNRVLINHNRLLNTYHGAIGIKTGYTRRCGRCLVSAAERNGVTMVAVTLSAPDDWNDHTRLLDYGFSQYTSVRLAEVGEYQFNLPCLGSYTETVQIANRDAVSVSLHHSHGAINVTVEAPHYLCAPIISGQNIGTLIFRCDNREIARIPLCAVTSAEPIQQKNSCTDRLKNLFGIFR